MDLLLQQLLMYIKENMNNERNDNYTKERAIMEIKEIEKYENCKIVKNKIKGNKSKVKGKKNK
jgi:hypothetical protein